MGVSNLHRGYAQHQMNLGLYDAICFRDDPQIKPATRPDTPPDSKNVYIMDKGLNHEGISVYTSNT